MIRRSALWAALVIPAIAAAQSCEPAPARSVQVSSERYSISFRAVPARIAPGQHFAVEFSVCPQNGAPAPESVRVDAWMPEHRHGMNYKAQVVAVSARQYLAEGLMFHMPGRWEYLFEVRAAGRTDRIASPFVLE